MNHDELEFVKNAHQFLENPSFLIRLANAVGKPVEGAVGLIPEKHRDLLNTAVQTALSKGIDVVSTSVRPSSPKEFTDSDRESRMKGLWHSAAAFGTGAGGGFFGIATLPLELPITTAIMLRSIASIADEFGMDLNDPKVQLDCLYVLTLGSTKSTSDDAMESAYWTSRIAFSRLIKDAARELPQRAAPTVARILAQIAVRYNVVVSQKAMAILVPAIGAVGGGAINAAFATYFNDAARFHFGLKALEKKYGIDAVQKAYKSVGVKEEAPA